MAMLVSKVYNSKKVHPTELAWHVFVSLRFLDPQIIMLYLFYMNHLGPVSEVMQEQKSV